MPHLDFDDEDVDALLDMCWTENPEQVPESPCAIGQADFEAGYNGMSTRPDESFVYVREVGCDYSKPKSIPAFRETLPKTHLEGRESTTEDPLGEMLPVSVMQPAPTKTAPSGPAPDLNLIDLPFEFDTSAVTSSTVPQSAPARAVLEPPKSQPEQPRTSQKPVCSDTFGEYYQDTSRPQVPQDPPVSVPRRQEYSRPPQLLAAEDPRFVTTLATTCIPSDELETLEEAIIEETQRIREIERVLEARKSRREQLRRDYAMALVRSVSAQQEPTPTSFTVVVTRSEGRSNIGLVVAYEESKRHLVVTHVKQDGLVPEANEERAIRNLPIVEVGDHLISINGVSGDKYMMTRQLVEGPLSTQLVFVKNSFS